MSEFICVRKRRKKRWDCVRDRLFCGEVIYNVFNVRFLGQLALDREHRRTV